MVQPPLQDPDRGPGLTQPGPRPTPRPGRQTRSARTAHHLSAWHAFAERELVPRPDTVAARGHQTAPEPPEDALHSRLTVVRTPP